MDGWGRPAVGGVGGGCVTHWPGSHSSQVTLATGPSALAELWQLHVGPWSAQGSWGLALVGTLRSAAGPSTGEAGGQCQSTLCWALLVPEAGLDRPSGRHPEGWLRSGAARRLAWWDTVTPERDTSHSGPCAGPGQSRVALVAPGLGTGAGGLWRETPSPDVKTTRWGLAAPQAVPQAVPTLRCSQTLPGRGGPSSPPGAPGKLKVGPGTRLLPATLPPGAWGPHSCWPLSPEPPQPVKGCLASEVGAAPLDPW